MSGEWDWDMLANEFDVSWLNDLGLAVPEIKEIDLNSTQDNGNNNPGDNVRCPKCGFVFES